MIQIRFPDEVPPEIELWIERAQEISKLVLSEEDAVLRAGIIDKYKAHWREGALVNWLSDIGFEKCWYTETKFGGDYQEIEHFRPKKGTKERDGSPHPSHPGYYWLAFDLGNYRLSKRRPNAKKSTFFPIFDERNRACCPEDDCADELPLFLDPMDEEDCLLLSFNDDGKPAPEVGVEGQDKMRVEFTIDKYFLDERILNMRRAETWAAARELYYKYLNMMKAAKAGEKDQVAKRAQAKSDLMALKSMLKPSCEFSSVAKAALLKTNDPMALKIVAHA